MEITLNSPKYAEAQSLQYQMYKKQKDRKKRKNFVPELFERYFRRNEGTTDYATIPEVTLSGAFRIPILMSYALGTEARPYGNSTGFDNEFKVSGDGLTVSFKINAGAFRIVTLDNPITTTHLNTVEFVRDNSNVCSIEINGVTQSATSINAGDFVIDQIYRAATTKHHDGILANLKIYDNGTLIRDYPLDDNSDILRDRATVLGSQLIINGDFSNGTDDWLILGSLVTSNTDNNSLSLFRNGGDGATARQTILTEIGKQYLITAGISDLIGNVNLGVSTLGNLTITNNGAASRLFTATAASHDISFAATGDINGSFSVSNVSIRQADGYGTVINGNASDWGLFQQQATGEWLGENRWHDVDVSFFGLQEQSIIYGDGSYKIATNDGTGTGVQDDTVDSRMVVGTYRISYNVTESLAGFLNFSDFTGPIDSTVGLKSLDVNATSARNLYFKRGTGVGATDITFNGVSVKEVLNVS